MKSSTTNVETSINKEIFHEISKSFQRESFSSSLNDDVQQSSKEVILTQTNTQSISNNMIPYGDDASTTHNVFNERLEDAYFDASTSFHDPSNVHTFYQPYPHEKKWTKDHPLYKIIGINYDETFVPVARIEAIRLFLAYAAHKDFSLSNGCKDNISEWNSQGGSVCWSTFRFCQQAISRSCVCS
nr:retrotransposon protein, putative, unclassified [Tanacetum cinerariifolium]